MAINQKLTVSEMKEMIELFVRHKLNAMKIGDLEIQKSHYESDPTKESPKFTEDPLFYSAPPLPPEMQEMLHSMMNKK